MKATSTETVTCSLDGEVMLVTDWPEHRDRHNQKDFCNKQAGPSAPGVFCKRAAGHAPPHAGVLKEWLWNEDELVGGPAAESITMN